MLTPAKRPSYLAGPLVLGFIIWTVLQIGLFHAETLDIRQGIRFSEQEESTSATYTFIESSSTHDGRYFSIDMGQPALNPNLIPHPLLDDTWMLVAQLRPDSQYFAELVCTASFHDGVLKCNDTPYKLPIEPTFGDRCTGELGFLQLNQGPHDARVFHGPRKPYTIYGSNSGNTCFGQWIHDFRKLMLWETDVDESSEDFVVATELQRPPPWSDMEKNWFLFWDLDGQAYVHHDVMPARVFASVDKSGAVSSNLGLLAQTEDAECMSKYMPAIAPELESIHQATNSLSITMCKRHDTSCTANTSNTFVFTIFQHKKYHNFHAVYEPYVLMFEQVPPFRIRAISTKPFWISGRKSRTADASSSEKFISADHQHQDSSSPTDQMLYITSMSWKDRSQRYHGFIDDVLFIAFGIEDEDTAAIDVVVGDLMPDLGFC